MNNSGDAAEQVVRFSLEGTEIALKLTGSAAKNIAAAMYAVLKNKDKNKLKGHQRLTAMLKSGKELKVFTIHEDHLKRFAREAKRYGVVYCALRGRKKYADGMVDVMVRAEDASKINRIVERFKMATVDAQADLNPLPAQMEKAHPSAPILEKPGREGEDMSESIAKRPSVREELRDIRAQRKKEDMRESVKEPAYARAAAEKLFPGGKSPGKKKRRKER